MKLLVCRGVHRVTDLEKFPVRVTKDEAPTPLPLSGLVIWFYVPPCPFLFPFLSLFCFFCVALCRKYGVSVFFRCEGCSQLALTSSGSLPVHFRVLLLLCWFTFPFIRPSFKKKIFYYISPGCLSILWTSWVRVWGLVPTDPLFVCPMHCCVLFRGAKGARVSSRLSTFLGWIVCVVCPVAVTIV